MKNNVIHAWLAAIFATMLVSCGSDISLPDDAKGTAEAILENLERNKPQVIWVALPPSYQKEANAVARAAIATLDAKLYDKILGILKKTNKILVEKKDFILKTIDPNLVPLEMGDVAANWDTFTDLMEVLLDSQLGSYEKAKNIDLGVFLEETGGNLMELLAASSAATSENIWQNKFLATLRGIKIKEISASRDKAILLLTYPGEEEKQTTWTKVEGKWIPQELQSWWKETISKTKEEIPNAVGEKTENKMAIMVILTTVESVLDQLDQAETDEEFRQVFENLYKLTGGNY